MTDHEELVGGCCVCSDDQGFANNALVYCDGKGCRVACHTACYGIVSIPDGDWYCRRCEVGEIQAPCCLCSMAEGAMKRTSDGNWAHVVCALYIPEVSFGNDETMEPIILSKIPSTRYGQTCSICIKNGRSKSEAMRGACCECRFKNCSKLFHVTCAQQAGFLYEDIRKNTWQYPIYCEHHRPKFSKFIRQVPPFHYQSLEQSLIIKQKEFVSKSSHSVTASTNQSNKSVLTEKKEKSNNETSQNLLKANPESSSMEQISQSLSNQNQSTVDARMLPNNSSKLSNTNSQPMEISTSSFGFVNVSLNNGLNTKIKVELNDTDYQVTESMTSDTNTQIQKKRQHSNDDQLRFIGPSLSKRLLVASSETATHSIAPHKTLKIEESQITDTQSDESVTNSPIRFKLSHQHTYEPQTLEEFLEQEWETTSDLLLQQNVSNDVSSLLSCLYQFKSENASLKKKFDELKHRRDSLRVINTNLRRKLSETLANNNTLTNSSDHRIDTHQTVKTSNSPIHENQIILNKTISSNVTFTPSTSIPTASIPYETIYPYVMNKNSQIPFNHGLDLELFSHIFTPTGPQLFAPTWNISNFGYANFPGTSSISFTDESIMRSYLPFRK